MNNARPLEVAQRENANCVIGPPKQLIERRPSGRHYPALDGLRGVAILCVVLFHGFSGVSWKSAFASWLATWPKMGWIGVDIFFVISGFLITGILVDTRDSAVHFRNFYARRFLRIIPVYWALLSVIFVLLPQIIQFSDGLKLVEHRQIWFWTHLTNISFLYYRKVWSHSDWLDLDHLWSLAVEEQFYLVWPLIVYFLSRRNLKITCGLCILLSLSLRCLLWKAGQRNGALYFPTPCRLDGLATGSLVALLVRESGCLARILPVVRATATAAISLLVGLYVMRGGLVFTDKPTVVFGITLVSLITGCVVAVVHDPNSLSWPTNLLSAKVLAQSGKYSYSLYLFHNVLRKPLELLLPPAAIAKAVGSEAAGNLIFICLFLGLSYAIAILSWHGYEKHWLKLKGFFEYRPT